MEAKTKEELKKEIIKLSTLIEVSEGYPACQTYTKKQDEKIQELLAIIKPEPKQTLSKRIKIWLIKKLSD